MQIYPEVAMSFVPRIPQAVLALGGALIAMSLGCGGSEDDGTRPAVRDPESCGELQVAAPDGGCQPVGLRADAPCAPGEQQLPDGRCQAAGVPPEACGPGFVPDDGGGCAAVLPDEACPPGLMAVPGESACREVAPCGEGDYGDIPVDDTTEFVDQAYAGTDSDGSRERPWTTVQDGLDHAARGAIVAVAAGRYEGDLVTRAPVHLWGRCPAMVEIVGIGSQPATLGVLDTRAPGSVIRGLSITGPRMGIYVDGAVVEVERVRIHDTEQDVGLYVAETATATVRGSLVERCAKAGVVTLTSLTISASVLRGSRERDGGAAGLAILEDRSGGRSEVKVDATVVEQNADSGVLLFGSDLTIDGSVVRDTLPNLRAGIGDALAGGGVVALDSSETQARSSLTMRSSVISGNGAEGVAVIGSDASIDACTIEGNRKDGVLLQAAKGIITSSVVRDTKEIHRVLGRGIDVVYDPMTGALSELTVRGSRVVNNAEMGVFMAGTDATIESSVVSDTKTGSLGDHGDGILLRRLGDDPGGRRRLTVRSSLVERNGRVGILVINADATIDDTLVRDSLPNGHGEFGDGIDSLSFDGEVASTILTATNVTGSARAGVLFDNSAGDISGVLISSNRFGLVLQGATRPDVDEANLIVQSGEQDVVADGDLAVPDAQVELP